MAITYTWEITNMRKAPQLNGMNNVLVHVRWSKTGTDENGTTGVFQGATPLSAPNSGSFTAYEDLTKEQVLGWVQAVVVGTYEQHVNEQIQKQITKKNDPQHKLPIKLAWKVTTAVRSLEPFAKEVQEPMKEIRLKYATRDHLDNLVEARDKEGNPIPNTITVPNDKIELLNQELDELLSQTVEVSNVGLKLSDFPESMELEPTALLALTPILKDE